MSQRLTFLEYLKHREQKRTCFAEADDIKKRENLLSHRFVLTESIEKILHVLTVPYAIIGGHAVTFHGNPRMTDDIDILILEQDVQTAITELQLTEVSTLSIGGYSGTTPDGMEIDLVSPNQKWVAAAIGGAVRTPYGPMVSGPFLVITKLWAARGAQDETDILGTLKRMSEDELHATRQLVRTYLPNDVDDIESLISMRNY